MANKYSKKIIQEAIKASIEGRALNEFEVPGVAGAKSVAGGVKGMFQGMGGNYRANRAKSFMTQMGQKTQKTYDKYAPKAIKHARKMQQSSNQSVQQTGQKIEDEVRDTGQRVKDLKADIDASFPGSISGTDGTARMGDPGSALRKDVPKDDPTVGFYKWLEVNHDINSERFHKMGRKAQDDLVSFYLSAVATKKGQQAKKEKLAQKLSQGLGDDKQELKQTGQIQQAPSQPVPQPPQPSSNSSNVKGDTDTVPQIQRRAATPQMPQQPSMKAAIGDIIKNKPMKLSPTDRAGVPPQVAQRMDPQKLQQLKQQQPVQPQMQPISKPQQVPGTRPLHDLPPDPHKAVTRPVQQPISLKDIGLDSGTIGKLNTALKTDNPKVKKLEGDLVNALKAGWGDVAKARISDILNVTQPMKQSVAPKGKNIKATQPMKKKQVEMPPEKVVTGPRDFKGQVDKALAKNVPSKFGGPPTVGTPEEKPKTQPLKVRVAEPTPKSQKTQNLKKVKKPSAKRKKKQEEKMPIMSMADFMKSSKDDPEQKKQAREKIKQEKKYYKSKAKRKGKKVLIQEK